MKSRLKVLRWSFIACFFSLPVLIAGADDSVTHTGLSLELIMADPDWIGNPPLNPWFSDDGSLVFYEQKRIGESMHDLYRVDLKSWEHALVSEAEWALQVDFPGVINPAQTQKVFLKEHDVFLKQLDSGVSVRVTQTMEAESAVRFSADGEFVMFRSGDALFRHAIREGVTQQYGQILAEDDPLLEDDTYSFLGQQQLELFTSLVDDKRKQQNLDSYTRERNPIDTVYVGKETLIRSITPSPLMDRVLVVTRKKASEGVPDVVMPNYVTDSGYVTQREVRSKVGESPPEPDKLLLANLEEHTSLVVDLSGLPGITSDPLKSLRQSALKWHVANGADQSIMEKQLKAPDVRDITVTGVAWNPQGTRLAVQLRAEDNKDRWIISIDPVSGNITPEYQLSDKSGWVNRTYDEFGWTRDGRRLWFLSEESGFSNLYVKEPGRGKLTNLTQGSYVVGSPVESRNGDYFYFIANKEDPGEYRLYRVGSDGKDGPYAVTSIFTARQRLTGDDAAPFILSRDESRVLFRHSQPNQPAEVYVQEVRPGASADRVTHTVSPQFEQFDWQTPRFVDIPSSHGAGSIRSRLYLPADNKVADKPRPAVIFVHGAGYLQNAHNGWSTYFREYMFHNLLTEHGVVVLDMDYRGSRGYGRDWRTAIYRQMGHPELEDLLDGVKFLVQDWQVDPARVGIYGGSYGGFLTLVAMFRAPETFAAGAALRPVTDWAHYNHGYTSNILNTPLVDPGAFQKSSPIHYAEQYANRPLLIAHGMQDDNVHFQDSVRLVQRLIELKKENFESAIYPLDPHGFTYPESWLDEYRRIFKLFRGTLDF